MATIVNTITQSSPSSSPTAGTQLKQFDSARITDVSGIGLNYDSGRFNDLHADSAHFNILSTSTFNLPSLNIDSANITKPSFAPVRAACAASSLVEVVCDKTRISFPIIRVESRRARRSSVTNASGEAVS